MLTRSLLAAALTAAALVAACSNDTGSLTDGSGAGGQGGAAAGQRSNAPAGTQGGAGGATGGGGGVTGTASGVTGGPVATNSPGGKAYYIANVHPFLASTCGGCHDKPGPGPNWLAPADAESSYAMLFSQGYVVMQSRLTVKGLHDGSTTNALNPTQITTFNNWVTMELADGTKAGTATPEVLQKLGACFTQTLFDAMKMGQWKTTQRTANNNTNNITPWNENANNCTGCNNTPCSACHSDDAATNFNDAEGNTILPPGTTFSNTKLTTPAYITKFFGVSPDGKAIASDGIQKKSDATKLSHAYSHPMFTLTTDQQTALTAFVTDAITKFNAGTCSAPTTTTTPPAATP
jgi:hypothetical protein